MENYEKKYKEALEKARQLCVYPTTKPFISDLQDLFHELKESDDEKVRKHLISLFEKFVTLGVANECETSEIKVDDILAWLEKQGEQKPVIKPKFKVGDWIVFNGSILYIKEVVKGYYRTISKGGITNSYDWDIDNAARLWTIEDAKDGDVLSYNDSKNNVWVCIFKEYANERVYDYCTLDKESFWEYSNWNYLASFSYTPATKEQRDLLFQKMHEAGYEWDAEKKELKKTEEEFNGEDYGIDSLWHARNILERTLGKVEGYETDDGILEHKCAISAVKQLAKQNNAWSEEDEKGLGDALWCCKQAASIAKDENNMGNIWYAEKWLKSLKERVLPQPKQEWSEEDEKMMAVIEHHLNNCGASITSILWLKSLRPHSTWKPSEEQMEIFEYYIEADICNKDREMLLGLYNDLKKLKGE